MADIVSMEVSADPTPQADVVFDCSGQPDLDWLTGMLLREAILLELPEGGYVRMRAARHSVDPGESFPRRVRALLVEIGDK